MTSIRDRMATACRAASVASAAGVAEAAWSSTTVPHVFIGLGAFVGQRNRGRCPFIEIEAEQAESDHGKPGGGSGAWEASVLVSVALRDEEQARDQAESIAQAAWSAILDLDDVPAITPGGTNWERTPIGWRLTQPLTIPVAWSEP